VIVRFLGTHNSESKSTRLVSFLVDEVLAVDAGSLASELTFTEQAKIKAILLSHGHYDHIRGVPAFAFNNTGQLTKVFATQEALEILSSHLIDGIIYPEFTSEASFLKKATVELVPLKPSVPQDIEGYQVTAIPVNHPTNGVGFYILSSDGKSIFYTGDTGPGLTAVWERVSPQLIIADVCLPNSVAAAASDAGHLCPEMLERELVEFNRINGYLPQVVLIHLSPHFENEIVRETGEVARTLNISIRIAHENETIVL